MSSNSEFRRKFPRRRFRRGVGFLHRGVYQVGVGHEVGEGGIAFHGSSELAIGDWVVVSFQISGGLFFSVQAEIRNVRPDQFGGFVYGCVFTNLKFESKREIRTFVTARSAKEQ